MQAPTHRLILILMLVLALAAQNEVNGQTQPAPPTRPFEGCYELTMGRWWPWSFGEDKYLVTPPDRIELLSETRHTGV